MCIAVDSRKHTHKTKIHINKKQPTFWLFIYDNADNIRYDTRCYINVRSKANKSQLNLPHGTDN